MQLSCSCGKTYSRYQGFCFERLITKILSNSSQDNLLLVIYYFKMEFQTAKHELIGKMPDNFQRYLFRIAQLDIWDLPLIAEGKRYWEEDTPVTPEKILDLVDSFMHPTVDGKPSTIENYDLAKPLINQLINEYFPGMDDTLSQADRVRKFRLVLSGHERYFRSQQHNRELLEMVKRG